MDRHDSALAHEILVVDSSEQASLALSTHTPEGQTNHLFCRHASEPWASFGERVERRVSRVCEKGKPSRLSYFLGELGDTHEVRSRGTLIERLARTLGPSCSLTFVALGAPRSEVDDVVTASRPAVGPGVSVDAQYTR